MPDCNEFTTERYGLNKARAGLTEKTEYLQILNYPFLEALGIIRALNRGLSMLALIFLIKPYTLTMRKVAGRKEGENILIFKNSFN